MTNSFFSHIFSVIALAALWLIIALWMVALNRQWWALRPVRRALWIAPLSGGIVILLWALGTWTHTRWLASFGADLSVAALVLSLALAVSLPFSGVMLTVERLVRWVVARTRRHDLELAGASVPGLPIESRPERDPAPSPGVRFDRSRRSFVSGAAVIIPAVTVSTGALGLIRSRGVRMPELPMTFDGLHPDLEGLRVLHLSDIHLGNYVDLDDLEGVMRRAEAMRPDLVLVSGDISDDLSVLPDALKIIAGLKAKHGTYASLGNHEYFRGIGEVVKIIDAGPIPLLRNSGTTIRIGNGELYVGGADDPVRMGQREKNHLFLQKSVGAAFDGAPSEAFHLLMSHRPEGLDVATEQGIAFTISGHTHGAQVGFNGRSVLEPWMPQAYLWGHYRKGSSQLYTSAGVGHWFPFRLGCPPEAPVYVLKAVS
jgi:predicted MPP superfamily phosphohydrolase